MASKDRRSKAKAAVEEHHKCLGDVFDFRSAARAQPKTDWASDRRSSEPGLGLVSQALHYICLEVQQDKKFRLKARLELILELELA